MNVCEYLLAGKPQGAVALLTVSKRYSFGDLERASRWIATALCRAGGQKGDRAVLVARSGFFWIAAYLGIMRSGLICVPVSPKSTVRDLQDIVGTTEPLYSCIESDLIPEREVQLSATTMITDLDIPASVIRDTGGHESPAEERPWATSECPSAGDDDLAALMLTSGSMGKPRCVMISHRNIIANTESIIQYMQLDANDRVMAVLPFDYCFGTSLLHTHLRVGGSIVIEPRFMYPQLIVKRLVETECTGFAGVPSHFQILLRRSKLAGTRLPHLRYVQQAGGQLAPAFIKELRKALPGKQIFIMYGQTEATARLSYLPPDALDAKTGSIGKGVPGVCLCVVNDLGQPVRPGECGEIVAEGPNIGSGYWKDEVESALTFRAGRLHTGDLATVDSDGFIFILDRAKDFLKCGGKRVSSRLLENILLEHPKVLEAAIVGVPDEILGEAAIAYAVPLDINAAPKVEELRLHCQQRLPAEFVPREFILVQSLPKNSAGKVLRAELRVNPPQALMQKANSWEPRRGRKIRGTSGTRSKQSLVTD